MLMKLSSFDYYILQMNLRVWIFHGPLGPKREKMKQEMKNPSHEQKPLQQHHHQQLK